MYISICTHIHYMYHLMYIRIYSIYIIHRYKTDYKKENNSVYALHIGHAQHRRIRHAQIRLYSLLFVYILTTRLGNVFRVP